jgi:hypothetical protein
MYSEPHGCYNEKKFELLLFDCQEEVDVSCICGIQAKSCIIWKSEGHSKGTFSGLLLQHLLRLIVVHKVLGVR